MPGKKRANIVSNERIVAALITHGTVAEVAKACKVAPRTVYNRMQEKEFKSLYLAAKTDIVRTASSTLNKYIVEAIHTTGALMKDKDTPPATRLQAANAIINHALKLAARVETEEERVEIIETTAEDFTSKAEKELQNILEDQLNAVVDMSMDIMTIEQKMELAKLVHDPEKLKERREKMEAERKMYEEETGENLYEARRKHFKGGVAHGKGADTHKGDPCQMP